MPVDYVEVFAEIEAEEARLLTQLNIVQAAKPAIQALRDRQLNYAALTKRLVGRFAGMGATKAIPMLLEGKTVPMTYREVHDALKSEGWTSASSDPAATVSATLSQLKDAGLVRKVGEGFLAQGAAVDYADTGITDDDIPF